MKVYEIITETIDLTKTIPVEFEGRTFLPISGDIIGDGLQSNVHKASTGTVIKQAFIDKKQGLNDPSVQFLKMVGENQNNPFFPKIYHAKIYEDRSSGNMAMLVQMEKLIPVDSNNIVNATYGLIDQLGIKDNIINPRRPNESTKDMVRKFFYGMTDTMDDIISGHESFADVFGDAKNPEFIKAMQVLLQGATKYGADLHPGNWMVRLTGHGPQLVLIDPFQPSSFRPGKEHYNPDMENDYETEHGVFL